MLSPRKEQYLKEYLEKVHQKQQKGEESPLFIFDENTCVYDYVDEDREKLTCVNSNKKHKHRGEKRPIIFYKSWKPFSLISWGDKGLLYGKAREEYLCAKKEEEKQ